MGYGYVVALKKSRCQSVFVLLLLLSNLYDTKLMLFVCFMWISVVLC